MKKKTVITTETREVWVIRQPGGDPPEREEVDANESEPAANSLIAPLGKHSETETPADEQN
jgi:hypothetical protein